MLTMAPLLCWRMIGITCLAARMQLLRLIATQRSKASSVMVSSSASPPARLTPTLLCSTSIRPQRFMVSSTIALISASLVTSALNAAAVPLSLTIRSTVSCAASRRWSTHSTFAPSRAKVSAVARPLPMPSPGLWPAPTTMATLSFKRISFTPIALLGDRVLLQYLFVIGLVVDLHGGEHAHHGVVEGDGQHQIDHLLVGKVLLDLGEGRHRHFQFLRHLARALEDYACQRLEQRLDAFGLDHHRRDVLVGDAELLADLHVMGELIFRLLQPADLEDGELAQAWVELALEADVTADAAERARHVGRVDQQLVQIGVAFEHVAIFGRDIVRLEIGQAGHPCFSSQCSSDSRSGACSVTPPSTTSTWPVM